MRDQDWLRKLKEFIFMNLSQIKSKLNYQITLIRELIKDRDPKMHKRIKFNKIVINSFNFLNQSWSRIFIVVFLYIFFYNIKFKWSLLRNTIANMVVLYLRAIMEQHTGQSHLKENNMRITMKGCFVYQRTKNISILWGRMPVFRKPEIAS